MRGDDMRGYLNKSNIIKFSVNTIMGIFTAISIISISTIMALNMKFIYKIIIEKYNLVSVTGISSNDLFLNYDYELNIDKINLGDIKNKLDDNKDLLINLISNGNLLEHETFTEMLMTIMHLKEELDTRYCDEIERYEIMHIEKDLMAVYKYLTIEWAEYMKYLSKNYPSLYCKALINNPFDTRDKKEKDKCFLENIK